MLEVPTPILDQLLHEARSGGIRTGRHCAGELSGNPGEVYHCARHAGHRDDHRARDVTW